MESWVKRNQSWVELSTCGASVRCSVQSTTGFPHNKFCKDKNWCMATKDVSPNRKEVSWGQERQKKSPTVLFFKNLKLWVYMKKISAASKSLQMQNLGYSWTNETRTWPNFPHKNRFVFNFFFYLVLLKFIKCCHKKESWNQIHFWLYTW